MRVVFMGSPEFALPTLERLLADGHDIAAVYTQPPRAAGRGHGLQPTPVHARALEAGLEVRTPENFDQPSTQSTLINLRAAVVVVAAYGLILPRMVLLGPDHGCLNVHPSLLPRWRGAAPIQRAIMAGDVETGVSIMRMEAGLDTGPICQQLVWPIGETVTAGDAHDALAKLGAEAMADTLEILREGPVAHTAQPEHGATYAAKIDKAETPISFMVSAEQVVRQINGLSPWPGAWFKHDGKRIKVLRSKLVRAGGRPGQVIDGQLTVACGHGAVRLLELQREGRAAMPAEAFLLGHALPAGTRLI